ncbi:MAG: TatD family hydrolase [Bacteroidia bacterium]
MYPLIDIHTHRKYNDNNVLFIRNAFLLNGITLPEKLNYPISVGLHPWLARANWKEELSVLDKMLHHPQVYAIGECGLDYMKGPDKSLQLEILEAHFHLAMSHDLPLILHMVRSLHDLIPFLKKHPVQVIIHDYSGSKEQTLQLLPYNVCFSLGQYFMKHSGKMQESVRMIPVDRIFTESDVHRTDLQKLYDLISTVKHYGADHLRKQLCFNFVRIFKRHRIHAGN